MIPCRNGEGRKSWTCDSGRYLDSCETSRSAWVTLETEGEALQTARRMSSSRMLYSSLAPIATAQAFLEDGNCTIGVRDVAAWSLRGPSITSARGAWRWYGFNNRLMSSSPSYSGDFTASAASLSKAERRTLVEKLVHCATVSGATCPSRSLGGHTRPLRVCVRLPANNQTGLLSIDCPENQACWHEICSEWEKVEPPELTSKPRSRSKSSTRHQLFGKAAP